MGTEKTQPCSNPRAPSLTLVLRQQQQLLGAGCAKQPFMAPPRALQHHMGKEGAFIMCTHFSTGTNSNHSTSTYTENWDGEHSSVELTPTACGSPSQLCDPLALWALGAGAVLGLCPPGSWLSPPGVVGLTWVVTRCWEG